MYASLGRTSGMMTRQNLGERLFMRLNRIAQVTVLLLIPAILSNSLAYAASRPPDAAAVKEKIAARGVGQKVRVTLADKTEAKGMIVSIGDQSFALTALGAAQPQSIQYAQVTGVHGDGLSGGAKRGIFVGIGGAALIVVLVLIARALGRAAARDYHE